jgi:hypothetical protein
MRRCSAGAPSILRLCVRSLHFVEARENVVTHLQ